MSINNF